MPQRSKLQTVAALIPHGKVRLLESMINTGLNGNRTLRVRVASRSRAKGWIFDWKS